MWTNVKREWNEREIYYKGGKQVYVVFRMNLFALFFLQKKICIYIKNKNKILKKYIFEIFAYCVMSLILARSPNTNTILGLTNIDTLSRALLNIQCWILLLQKKVTSLVAPVYAIMF